TRDWTACTVGWLADRFRTARTRTTPDVGRAGGRGQVPHYRWEDSGPRGPARLEKRLHQLTAVGLAYAGNHLDVVIVSGEVDAVDGGRHRTRPRFGSTEYERLNARMDERADAHQAGLDRDTQHGAGQPVVPDRSRRVADGDDFGVRRRVVRCNRLVEPAAHIGTVERDYRADRYLAGIAAAPRLVERGVHPAVERRRI